MDLQKVRVDKWLWSVRIFKSRTLATSACKASKVQINQANAKPSATVEVGDEVSVKKNGYNFQFKVVKLIQKRVGAPIAQTCYENHTPVEELRKYEDWFVGKATPEHREKGAGRPTKRERRQIDDFKTDILFDWDDDD